MPFSLLGTTLTASLQGDSPWPVDYHKYNHAGYIVVRWERRERKKNGEGLSQKLGTWPNLCIILPLSAVLLELLFLTLESHDFLFLGIKRVSQHLASLQCSYNANIAN